MRGRCERHQLALGPSGCLICRREQALSAASSAAPAAPVSTAAGGDAVGPAEAAPLREAPTGPSAEAARTAPATPTLGPRRLNIEISPWALLVPAAALGIYLASAVQSGIAVERAARANGSTAAATLGAVDPVAERDAPAELTGDSPAPEPLVAPAPAEAPAEAEAEAEAEPEAQDAFEPASPALTGERERAPELGRAQQVERARELANARELVDITVYYTSWCPACRAARGYLSERGIRFVEHDVEHDARAKSRQKLLNPRGSIPTIDIEGQVLVGFNPTKIEHAIDHAARQRLAR
jgi:glutaredoxin